MDADKEKTTQLLRTELRRLRQQVNALPSPEQSRRTTIELLHRYNMVKDAAQVVIGVVADRKQCTVASVHKELDLPLQ